MAITEMGPGPSEALGDAGARIAGLTELLWAARSDDELVEVIGQVQQLRALLTAIEAGAVAEVDTREIPRRTLGWASTGDWLTHLGGLRRGAGRRVVRRAHALTGERERTLRALAAGRVSSEQSDVILEAVDHLPTAPRLRRRGEQHLLACARRFDATDLSRAARHLTHVIDPDGTDRRLEAQLERDERAAHHGRYLAISDDGAGGVRLKGRGSAEDAAVLRAALLPMTAPQPPDPHSSDEADLSSPGRDLRDHGARLWDALVAAAQHALDTDLPPASHGAVPRITITVEHDRLVAGLGEGTTDDGMALSAGTIRRLACDAHLIPVVLGTDSAVLDVGRAQRLVTPTLWRALVARDGHCAFPSCTRPPVMCHAHHIRHWSDGGPTSLDNLVLLCGHHHRTIHHTPWEVVLDQRDRRPDFHPPPRAGDQRPPPIRHRPRRE